MNIWNFNKSTYLYMFGVPSSIVSLMVFLQVINQYSQETGFIWLLLSVIILHFGGFMESFEESY